MKHFYWNAFDVFFPKRQRKLKTRINRRVRPTPIIELQQETTKDDSRQCRSGETTEETTEVQQKADECKPNITVEVHQMNEIICHVKNLTLTPNVNEMTAIEI